eukprot:1179942-Prorocentrum_minimum.AAC.1
MFTVTSLYKFHSVRTARTFSQVYAATSRNDAHRGFALGTIEENSYRPHHLGYKPVDGTNCRSRAPMLLDTCDAMCH